MTEVEEVPEHRCGFELTPEDPRVNREEDLSRLWNRYEEISCCREPWRDSEHCIWHADVEDKPIKELRAACADGPERLDGVRLTRLDAGELPLRDCTLVFADFTDADLVRADFTDADLRRVDFTDADLVGADFTDATLTNADFTDAFLISAEFTRAGLINAEFTRAGLINAEFTNAFLCFADLSGADLTDADFINADLMDANLPRACFRGADFTDADLRRVDFTDADLTRVNFIRADLRNSYLTHATLHDTILTQADCRGATFTSALMYEVVFADTRINSRTTFHDPRMTYYESITSHPACVYEENPLTSEDLPEETHRLEAAEWVYRRLEKLHDENALSEEAREFHISKEEARREHQRQQLAEARERLSEDLADNNTDEAYESFIEMLQRDTRYSVSTLQWHLTRHGESIRQIFVSAGVLILACGLVYPFVGGFESSANDTAYRIPLTEAYRVFSLDGIATLLQGIYFSIITFTTIGYGDLYPTGTGSKVLVGFESLAGAILIALFVFVLGRQVAR